MTATEFLGHAFLKAVALQLVEAMADHRSSESGVRPGGIGRVGRRTATGSSVKLGWAAACTRSRSLRCSW